MIIYEKEKSLGLEEAILAHAKAFLSVKIIPNDSFSLEKYPQLAKACAKQQILPNDLFVFDNIQVSSGWNQNDDIFLKDELWKGKGSVIHKPLNFNHDKDIIIGHTIAAYPVDQNYNLLVEDVPEESLPDLYHIYATDVIYTKTQNPEFDSYVAELITQIKKGEWSVSMECRMDNFDYGLMDPQGKSSILPRNEATAGYTQYLRIFGGTGEYAGYKIGRVFRNINFIGKGVVKTPANPYSIIFSENLFSLGYISADTFAKANLEKPMEENQVATLEAKVAELEQSLASVNEALKAANDAAEAAKKEKKDMEDNWKKAKSDLETASNMNSEETKRIKKIGAKAERVDSLLKSLADDVLLKLYEEAAQFVEENADLEDSVYERVAKHFLSARKASQAAEAAVAKAGKEEEVDLEEEEKPVVETASAEVEEETFEFTPENSAAIARFLKNNFNKNAFRSIKGDK